MSKPALSQGKYSGIQFPSQAFIFYPLIVARIIFGLLDNYSLLNLIVLTHPRNASSHVWSSFPLRKRICGMQYIYKVSLQCENARGLSNLNGLDRLYYNQALRNDALLFQRGYPSVLWGARNDGKNLNSLRWDTYSLFSYFNAQIRVETNGTSIWSGFGIQWKNKYMALY